MRIAVASDGLDVSLHGVQCASYMCYLVERGVIVGCQNTPCPCASPELTARFMQQLGIDALIAQNVESELRGALAERGIDCDSCPAGPTRCAVEAYVSGLLSGDASFDDEAGALAL